MPSLATIASMSRSSLVFGLAVVACIAVSAGVATPGPQTLKTTTGFQASRQSFAGSTLVVAQLDPRVVKLRLYWQHQGTGFLTLGRLRQHLQRQNHQVLATMNAGIFDTSYRPLGLHIENTKTLRPINTRSGYGNFYLKPNGVFFLQGDDNTIRAKILETTAFVKSNIKPIFATQSGPLLLKNNQIHPAFRSNSNNRLIRNGIGVSGNTVFMVLSETEINLYDFARFFRDVLGCSDALYLDGSISAMSIPGTDVASDGLFAAMFAVLR
jgi:uncharacterized protein YigE (DUF2233 family)